METNLDVKQREDAAAVAKFLDSNIKETNRRDAMSRNQKIMKAVYLSTPNLFSFGMGYLPLQQALYAAGYRISYSRAKDESKRLNKMNEDFQAIRMYEETRDETNLNSLLHLIDEMEKVKMGLPTKRKMMKAAITLLAGSSYMRTSNVGMGTRGKTEFQKRVFGSAIRQNLQNSAMNELSSFGFGEIISTGKDYSKDSSGKSISSFRIYRKNESPSSSVSSLFSYFVSIKLSFLTPIEELSTEYKTLMEEYRVLLDIMYPAFQDFQLYNTIRKGEEEYKRAVWNEEHPEFAANKKLEDEKRKAEKELAFKEANKLTAYRKAQIKAGYAVINPDGEYVRPKTLDAFMKSEIDNGYRILDQWGNIKDTGKRTEEVAASLSAPQEVSVELWSLLETPVSTPESHVDELINSKDTTPRMSLNDMKNYDPEPVFIEGSTPAEHMKNLKAYTEAKKAWDMRHLCDDMEF